MARRRVRNDTDLAKNGELEESAVSDANGVDENLEFAAPGDGTAQPQPLSQGSNASTFSDLMNLR